jgi:hypothetical protein
MARALVPTVVSTTSGVALPTEADGDPVEGHYVQNSGKTKVFVRNSNAASTARVVTFRFYRTVDGQSVTSRAESIPAGETQVFGPFPVNDYGTQLLIDADNAELKLRAVE